MHIVFVDDEPKEFLADEIASLGGYRLTQKQHLDDAYQFLKDNPWSIDLVFIDEVFKNIDADSRFRGGMELGTTLFTEIPYLPMVMFTGNAQSSLHTKLSFKNGFIDYYSKADVSKGSIRSILQEVKTSNRFMELCARKQKCKKEMLKQLFGEMNSEQRHLLDNCLKGGEKLLHRTLRLGELTLDVDQILEGWLDPRTIIDEEARSALSDLLHQTDQDIVFKGQWEDAKGLPRQYLRNYEGSESHSATRYTIDLDAANLLLEIFNIARHYNGKASYWLKNNPVKDFTAALKLQDAENLILFRKKMVARRVLISCSRSFEGMRMELTLNNVLILLTKGITGTQERSNGPDKPIVYRDMTPGSEPRNVVNKVLGLSYGTTGIGDEFFIKNERPFVLFEEHEFHLRIGQYMPALKGVLDLEIPDNLLPDNFEINSIARLQDLQKMLNATKVYSIVLYGQLLTFLHDKWLGKHRTAIPALEYLLDIPLNNPQ